jgi:hypothetical protein
MSEKKAAYEADDGQLDLTFDEEAQEVELPFTENQSKEDGNHKDDDDHEQYSKSVQKRINQLTKKTRDAEREREEALRYAQQVQNEAVQIKQRLQNLDKSYVDEYGYRVSLEQKQAEQSLRSAIDLGDSTQTVEAQKRLNQLAIAADKHQQAKQARERQAAQALAYQQQQSVQQTQYQPAPQQQRPDPKAETWASKNTWFGEDYAMTFAAFGLHKQLVEDEAFDPKSDEYYDELDKRMRREFPQKLEGTNSGRRGAQTVAGVSRSASSGRGKKVRLTPSQVSIAKKLGVPLEEYAKYVKD